MSSFALEGKITSNTKNFLRIIPSCMHTAFVVGKVQIDLRNLKCITAQTFFSKGKKKTLYYVKHLTSDKQLSTPKERKNKSNTVLCLHVSTN